MMKTCQCTADARLPSKLTPFSDLCPGDLIVEIGRLFIHTPYKAGTLEAKGRERLVVNWTVFDCTTFLETVLALARCISTGKISHDHLRKNLKLIRYRNGKINGYSSRLHYFTDWLRDNESRKILADLSGSLGGRPRHKKINFMTSHPELYPALENKQELKKMSLVEKNLTRKVFNIIGTDKVDRIKTKVKNGDIIALAAKQEGLDVTHVGFALWQGKSLRLLHASQKEGRVVISAKSLPVMLKQNNKTSGIIVARFL